MTAAQDYLKLIDSDTTIEDKLDIIEKLTNQRLAVLLGVDGVDNIPDKFAYIGGFSGAGNIDLKNIDTTYNGIFKNRKAFNDNIHVFFLGIGSEEHPERTKKLSDGLKAAGINNIYYESPGTAHEFLTWRRCLKEFAPLLFK